MSNCMVCIGTDAFCSSQPRQESCRKYIWNKRIRAGGDDAVWAHPERTPISRIWETSGRVSPDGGAQPARALELARAVRKNRSDAGQLLPWRFAGERILHIRAVGTAERGTRSG